MQKEPGAGPKKERKERGPCRALCHKCGRRGHVSRDCRQMMALCTICHKYGHSKVECPRNGGSVGNMVKMKRYESGLFQQQRAAAMEDDKRKKIHSAITNFSADGPSSQLYSAGLQQPGRTAIGAVTQGKTIIRPRGEDAVDQGAAQRRRLGGADAGGGRAASGQGAGVSGTSSRDGDDGEDEDDQSNGALSLLGAYVDDDDESDEGAEGGSGNDEGEGGAREGGGGEGEEDGVESDGPPVTSFF